MSNFCGAFFEAYLIWGQSGLTLKLTAQPVRNFQACTAGVHQAISMLVPAGKHVHTSMLVPAGNVHSSHSRTVLFP